MRERTIIAECRVRIWRIFVWGARHYWRIITRRPRHQLSGRPMRVTSSHFRAQEFQVQIFGGLHFPNGQAAGAGDAKKTQDSVLRRSAQTPVRTPARSGARHLRGQTARLPGPCDCQTGQRWPARGASRCSFPPTGWSKGLPPSPRTSQESGEMAVMRLPFSRISMLASTRNSGRRPRSCSAKSILL
jgi:hypothetical protein